MNALILAAASLLGQPYEAYEAYEVTDLRDQARLVILVFGDAGTGDAGQHRVGRAMYEVCRRRACQLALMLGDNIYENGIEVRERDNVEASYREILDQFEMKFEAPYQRFEDLRGFHFWGVLGNHDYRRNTLATHITYSEFSKLWRIPALHYEVPKLPEWIQIYGLHTDSDVRRDLNGLQIHSARRTLCEERAVERWKIVFGHHPLYNSGHHRDDANERRTRALVEGPLLRACGVHLYLAGHAHHQEHVTVSSFEHIIQASAGKSKGSNREPKFPGVSQRHFSDEFGFAVLEVDAENLRIDFYDVFNTRERADWAETPGPEDIFASYSWCGTRDDVGKPSSPPRPCR
jgi:tartrate-resistant acid phosphatase type 5